MALVTQLGHIVLPIVAIVEIFLASLVLHTGRYRFRQVMVAVILVANALEAIIQATWDFTSPIASAYTNVLDFQWFGMEVEVPQHRAFTALEAAISWSLVMLIAWTPATPKRPRIWQAGYVVFLAAMLVSVLAFYPTPARAAGIYQAFPALRWWYGWLPWLVAAGVLVFRSWPGTLRLPPGLARAQALLILTGATIPLLWQFALFYPTRWGHPRVGLNAIPDGAAAGSIAYLAQTATAFLVLGFVTLVIVRAVRRRGDMVFPATVLSIMTALALVRSLQVYIPDWGFSNIFQDLFSQFIRPAFFAVAFLRFDAVRLPRKWAHAIARVAVALVASGGFVLMIASVNRDGYAATDVPLIDGLLAVATLLVLGVAFGRPALRSFYASIPGTSADEKRRQLDQYRMALERGDGGLDRLRRDLGLDVAEVAAVEAVLEGRLLVPATAVRGLRQGDLVDGRLRVVGPLGQGGEGTVVLARDATTGEDVVIKSVNQAWAADAKRRHNRLRSEASAGALVGRRVDIVDDGPMVYLVRPHIPGRTLAEALAEGPIQDAAWRRMGSQLLEQVAAFHRGQTVHGDIKPSNIVITPDGDAVLIDEGGRTDATQVLGTAAWAAPEQWAGTTDWRTDMYQLAKVMDASKPPGVTMPRLWKDALSPDPGRRPTLRAMVRG